MLCCAGILADGLHCGVCGCWWHSSVWAALGVASSDWWPNARRSVQPLAPHLHLTSSLAILPPKRFSPLSSRHPTLFLPLFFFLSASAALPPALSPYIGSSHQAARSDSACLSFPFPLGLSRSVLSIDPLPLGPSALSVSLWPADLCFVSCMTHFYPRGWCSDAPRDRVSI